jgi:hypothetical protein
MILVGVEVGNVVQLGPVESRRQKVGGVATHIRHRGTPLTAVEEAGRRDLTLLDSELEIASPVWVARTFVGQTFDL